MKLYRFTASTTEKAITDVSEELGPDALVYSTRKIPGGVEVLAGLPFGAETIVEHNQPVKEVQSKKVNHKEVKIQEQSIDSKMLEKLKLQIEMMSDSMQTLSVNVNSLQNILMENVNRKKFSYLDVLKFYGELLHKIYWDILSKIDITKLLLKIRIRSNISTNVR